MNIINQRANQLFHTSFKLIALVSLSLGVNMINASLIWAKPLIYNFTVTVVEGSLKGNVYDGFFVYDDEQITRQGRETINPQQGLKVCMNFFNQMHRENKDVDYPEYPILTLEEGKPETLDFWIEPTPRRLWWNSGGWEVEISQAEDNLPIPNCSQ
jgi:hypothetical protein